ncbi:MAG: hypothetical protein IPN69_14885 [Acidobacteria bacterium]|nr:hypothetical protein [Acidobacteriota bacterium]
MFKLSQTHNQAFYTCADAEFVCEVVSYLFANHAETRIKLPDSEFAIRELPENRLRKMVKLGIKKARGYGMSWQSSLIAFVVIMVVTAPNFDENIRIRSVISDEKVFPEERLDLLWSETDDAVWEEVSESYDPKCWFAEADDLRGAT